MVLAGPFVEVPLHLSRFRWHEDSFSFRETSLQEKSAAAAGKEKKWLKLFHGKGSALISKRGLYLEYVINITRARVTLRQKVCVLWANLEWIFAEPSRNSGAEPVSAGEYALARLASFTKRLVLESARERLRMIFTPTDVEGAYEIDPEPFVDERGMIACVFDDIAFRELGLETAALQFSVSFNPTRHAADALPKRRARRGKAHPLHPGSRIRRRSRPAAESPSFRRWTATELTAANHRQLYVPRLRHGSPTLESNSEVYYQIFQPYVPYTRPA